MSYNNFFFFLKIIVSISIWINFQVCDSLFICLIVNLVELQWSVICIVILSIENELWFYFFPYFFHVKFMYLFYPQVCLICLLAFCDLVMKVKTSILSVRHLVLSIQLSHKLLCICFKLVSYMLPPNPWGNCVLFYSI